MCGRYAASKNPDELVEEFEVDVPATETLGPDYNVAPTRKVYAVLEREPKAEKLPPPGEPPAPAVRLLHTVRWGLVPSWAKDVSIGNKLVNARSETVAEKPSFKRALSRRRCLVPADGYYEWYTPEAIPGSKSKPIKQPFFLHPKDGSTMAMAGLYELWRDPEKPDDDSDAWLWSMTLLTTTAADEFGRIHDRMPMTVSKSQWGDWLDPELTDVGDAQSLLLPLSALGLEVYPVSTLVNNVRNNSAQLLAPAPIDDLPPGDALGSGEAEQEVLWP
jgi:putative SOS response-associated peptidase YedK